jgi:acyl-CoA thioester hydrolase
MGHMNVMWYVGKFDEATWNLFAGLGVTTAFLRDNERAMGAVQQNITYKRELLSGDIVAVRSGLLEIREKVVKLVHEMRQAHTGEIAAVCVLTAVHMDSKARRSTAFPAEFVARGRTMLCEYEGAQ